MEILVLGRVAVFDDDGTTLLSGGSTQRHLLAILAAQPGRLVSSERLQELLGISSAGLRTAVSRLRRSVGEAAVVSRSRGYALETGAIDAARFEALLEDARAGRPDQIEGRLTAALELWRGPAFAEFADEPWAAAEVARLDELRAGATEDLAQTMLDQRRWTAAAALLERHIGEFPYRDRPRGLLMRALAGDRRQTEALRVYDAYRRFLGVEVGTEPSTELQELEARIISGWSDADADADADGRPTVDPVGGPGDDEPPPSRRLGNMPAPITEMVGRIDVLDTLETAVREHRLITITGPAGVGKTRLVIELGRRLGPSFPGGCWLVELAQLPTDADIEDAVVAVLSQATGATSLASATAARGGAPRLVVLDNCEHVLPSVAKTAAALLAADDELTVVCTSRHPVDVPGELVHQLSPLATSESGGGRRSEAAILLAERTGDAGTVDWSTEDETIAERICSALEGLPLAIELASARLRTMTLSELELALDHQLDFLERSWSDTSRHVSLEAALEWSFRLLDRDEQLGLPQLSVFAAPFDHDALTAVVTGTSRRPDDVARTLADKSLLQRTVADGRTRFSVLEPIRQFAAARLQPEARSEVHRRHVDHVVLRAEAALAIPDHADARDQLEPLLPELQIAATRRPDVGSGVEMKRLLDVLAATAVVCGRAHLERGAAETALEFAEDGLAEAPNDLELLGIASDAAWRLGRSDTALASAEQWAMVARGSGHPTVEAEAIALIARLRIEEHDGAGTHAALGRLQGLTDALPDGRSKADATARLAQVYMLDGRYDDALRAAEAAIALAEKHDATTPLAGAYIAKGSALGFVAKHFPASDSSTRLAEGIEFLRRAHRLASDANERVLTARALYNRAELSPVERPDLLELVRTTCLEAGLLDMATSGVGFLRAEAAQLAGDLDSARQGLEPIRPAGLLAGAASLRAAILDLEAGAVDEAARILSVLDRRALRSMSETFHATLADVRVAVHLGDVSRVRQMLDELVTDAVDAGWRLEGLPFALDEIVESGIDGNCLAPLLAADEEDWGPDEAFLCGWLAEQADPSAGRGHYQRALSGAQAAHDNVLAAIIHTALGRLDLSDGNTDAYEQLQTAVALLERWPGPRLERAQRLLDGVTP